MKTVEIKRFAGVRNDVSPERFKVNDRDTGLTDLAKAENIELDETGKPYRRIGITVADPTPAHSLWAEGDLCFCVRSGTLHRVEPDLTFVNLGYAITGPRVTYRKVLDDVYFSDGVTCGVYSDGKVRAWGISTPPAPALSTPLGELREGTYLVAITYVRANGLESGASPLQSITVDGKQGIGVTVTASADPTVTAVRIYVSDWNGELPYLVATRSNSDALATISALPSTKGLALRTVRCGPPPPAQVIGYYKGRLYVSQDNYLWYTQPYEFELIHRATNYLGFSSAVKTFAPVSDGIYVGSDTEIAFLSGDDPTSFKRTQVAPYGAVLGTEVELPAYYFMKGDNPTPVQVWMSKQGLVAGLDGGNFMNLTGSRYVLPEGVATGASLLKIRGASPQLVTTLFS